MILMKMYKKFITRFDTNEGYLYLSVKFISISNNLTSVFDKVVRKTSNSSQSIYVWRIYTEFFWFRY